jgi:uncharacterized protein (DUF3084 family)
MYYGTPDFTGIDAAIKYINDTLQQNINKNNDITLDIEQTGGEIELLKAQKAKLKQTSEDLLQEVSKLEAKRTQIKQEVRDHTEKTTARLEKERADFETVRIKERNRLITLEDELNKRFAELEQSEIRVQKQTQEVYHREEVVRSAGEQLATKEQDILKQSVDLDNKKTELLALKQYIKVEQQDVENAKNALETLKIQSDKRQKQVEDLVKLSEERMIKIETIDKQQSERANMLNIRESKLREFEKQLNIQKIRLDDRSSTIASR